MELSNSTFAAATDRFIQYVELELGRSANTVMAYRKDLANLFSFAQSVGCGKNRLHYFLATYEPCGIAFADQGC